MVVALFFLSNHHRGPNTHVHRFLERHGIPYHYLNTTMDDKREGEILELVQNTDFLVLARYMQVNQVTFSPFNYHFELYKLLAIEVCSDDWRNTLSPVLSL